MIKVELAEKLAKKIGVSATKAEQIVNAFCDGIMDAVAADGVVRIQEFGTFERRGRPARVGLKPVVGTPIQIPARTVPWFRPAPYLNEIVNLYLGPESNEIS